MKLQDPVRWADQEMELQVDEYSRMFLKLFVSWLEASETILMDVAYKPGTDMALSGLRQALGFIEAEHQVILSMEVIGQMLLMAVDHWEWGADLDEHLSTLERRMMQQMAAIKLASQQESATL